MTFSLIGWLRRQIEGWQPSAVGIFQELAEHEWPLSADSPADLRHILTETGHLLPLPTEPAALANVMEIDLRQHLIQAAEDEDALSVRVGTERSYPDLEFTGLALEDRYWAVDIKCARRKSPTRLNNAIALYTGNTWFLWPQLKFGSVLRPFNDYQDHLAVLVMYEFDPDLPERIRDVVVVAHETWRVASKLRASATREYIGSVVRVDDLLAGRGEFKTRSEFYEFWRSPARRWKDSPEAKKLLRRALEKSD
jgi:hypothetical protein